ncbi:hypothetical protein [Sphaerisporangium fuscum]|uniref:hypothetical protein n=1 Tax=Sphaerisporangium fuscum TaxID=2835868 RepID=UPI001BDCAB9C|nr:hypothetical protein [Sphaerisporangium fuscum]
METLKGHRGSLLSWGLAAVEERLTELAQAVHLRHHWYTIEMIGLVVTQQCADCERTRVRVRSPKLMRTA